MARRCALVTSWLLSCIALEACSRLAPPTAHAGAPLRPAVHAAVDLIPLDLSPDGELRLLVRLHYTAADGARTHIAPGGHVDVAASRGSVMWQPRARFGDPAAIVRLTEAGPVELRVRSDIPRVPRLLAVRTDTRAWRLPAVTARALGPHCVALGWFPRVRRGAVRITRRGDGPRVAFLALAAPASNFRDATVRSGAQYTYEIRRPGADPIIVGVGVPPDHPAERAGVLRGKAMWLSFDDDAAHWNVDTMLDRARNAQIRAIELRLCYGDFDEITPPRRAAIERLIDGAAARGIAVLAWTVPRAASFEDLAANVAAGAYRTRAGHGLSGIAVDLERGADFLGTGAAGYTALGTYLARLREAVGPRELLVATVEDPHLEQLSAADVPYAAIAAWADVLQPMVYWRAHRAGASTAGMRADLRAATALIGRLAGKALPIDIGGQTASLGNRYGAPPPAEIAASIVAAHALGALGETFYEWNETTAAQWTAIAATAWPPRTEPPRSRAGANPARTTRAWRRRQP